MARFIITDDDTATRERMIVDNSSGLYAAIIHPPEFDEALWMVHSEDGPMIAQGWAADHEQAQDAACRHFPRVDDGPSGLAEARKAIADLAHDALA